MSSRTKIISIAIILSTFLLVQPCTSFSATTFSIESASLLAGETDIVLDFSVLNVDPTENIDSFTFDFTLSEGLSLTDVVFLNVPEAWSANYNLSKNRLGATDFGYPASPLSSDLIPFAELYFTIDQAYAVPGSDFTIGYDFYEVVDSNYSPVQLDAASFIEGTINVVPIPSALILLGCGLAGMVGIRRRQMRN